MAGPVAHHAKALELLHLRADPLAREFAAFLAELVDRHLVLVLALLAILLLDLPFDGQAVAVPAGDVAAVIAEHLVRPDDNVLQYLVEGVADMQVAVGVGRPVVQLERLASRALRPLRRVEADPVPVGQPFRLALGQAGPHREVGLRQEQRVPVVGGLGHGSRLASGLRMGAACMAVRTGEGKPLVPGAPFDCESAASVEPLP